MTNHKDTPVDLALDMIQAERLREILSREGTIIIGVAGGSGTGKSSAITQSILAWVSQHTTEEASCSVAILPQDDFQLGRLFTGCETSSYRWDDPRNFDLPMVRQVLQDIRSYGQSKIPSFSLKAVTRGEYRTFTAPKITILEGLYALHPQIRDQIDYGVYVEVPLAGRVVRRIFRFLYEHQIDKPLSAIRQSLTTVLKAHREQVIQQRFLADFVLTIPYSFEETAKKFSLPKLPTPRARVVERYTPIPGEAALILAAVEGRPFFQIQYKSKIVLSIAIDDQLASIARSIDWDEF